jgi:dihydroneopterin aldolase
LQLDLDYVYEAGERDDLYASVVYGTVVESVTELLEKGGFRLLETGRGW